MAYFYNFHSMLYYVVLWLPFFYRTDLVYAIFYFLFLFMKELV